MQKDFRPHIVLVVARGEAVRNFLYSDTLSVLSKSARITLLSLVDHGEVMDQVRPYVEQIIPLNISQEHFLVTGFRELIHNAHFRWVWSGAVKYYWGLHDGRAKSSRQKLKRLLTKGFARLFSHRFALEFLTKIDEYLSWVMRPTKDFDEIFNKIKPDFVFNCSHIHGPQADLPLRVAHRMGIPTGAFIFSWDNLTSRSRIFVPYDYYFMWNEEMKAQLLDQYRNLSPDQVIVTGTPQFDFHFKPEYCLSREELCSRLGIDPARPFILYTTGMDTDFLDEHKFIEAVIRFLQESDFAPKPQMVVRTYIKGTSQQVLELASQNTPDVVFPPILWNKQWIMPLQEDLYIYTSLLHHCALGINAASTVTLELMALDKPVINIGMEPPGSILPYYARFSRHVEYEHFRPVAASGGTMVACSLDDLRAMIRRGLSAPEEDSEKRLAFIYRMMGGTLDGNAGRRVAEQLIKIANYSREENG
jgi:hypothetical protein